MMMRTAAYAAALLLAVSCSAERNTAEPVRRFIDSSWELSVRCNPADSATLVGLPHPYTVPSISGMFQEMYYWDTFFTNEGLLLDGRVELARNNTDNLLSMVERFGFVPNGNRTWYLNRSQPPYLAMMVERVYNATGEREWLRKAFGVLVREYEFWMTHRMTSAGLNRYSSEADESLLREFVRTGGERLGHDFAAEAADDEALLRLGRHFAAEAESGWDFTPRFERRCEDFIPIDLNSNLYIYETLFARWSEMFGDREASAEWQKRADARARLMHKLCKGGDGLWYDCDFTDGHRSEVVSAAVFSLLWAGIPDAGEARLIAEKGLERLECEHGIAACAEGDYRFDCQWSYPNAWAPLTYIAVRGLAANGFEEDARRIARKYVESVAGIFAATGNLWEKYNVRTGGTDVNDEYEMPAMLGWSAGVFVYMDEWLEGRADK